MPGNKSADASNLSIDGLTPDMLMSEPADRMGHWYSEAWMLANLRL